MVMESELEQEDCLDSNMTEYYAYKGFNIMKDVYAGSVTYTVVLFATSKNFRTLAGAKKYIDKYLRSRS